MSFKSVIDCPFASFQQSVFTLQLLNAFCVSPSVQRAVYKDLVLLLQNDKYLSPQHLKTKASIYILIIRRLNMKKLLYSNVCSFLSSSSSLIFLPQGEMSFEQDCLVEGGCLNPMHNGIEYKEVRQYQCAHHLVRFYFVTRVYSNYVQSILEDFRKGLKPDVVILNSCVWDISRWVGDGATSSTSSTDYLGDVLLEKHLNSGCPQGLQT